VDPILALSLHAGIRAARLIRTLLTYSRTCCKFPLTVVNPAENLDSRSFGDSSDKPTPGDYDGDGRTDFGVWRPINGYWYTAPISESNPAQNFNAISFGINGDVPQPADFDGDGKTDKAVWRPNSSYWWILKSSDNTSYALQWGLETDILVSSAYFYD